MKAQKYLANWRLKGSVPCSSCPHVCLGKVLSFKWPQLHPSLCECEMGKKHLKPCGKRKVIYKYQFTCRLRLNCDPNPEVRRKCSLHALFTIIYFLMSDSLKLFLALPRVEFKQLRNLTFIWNSLFVFKKINAVKLFGFHSYCFICCGPGFQTLKPREGKPVS